MAEEIPMEDFPKGTDDDDDYDWDDTTFQTTNTSTSLERDYPGYDDYNQSRDRAQWENPPERMNLGERDEEYDRRREAGQELKRYLPDFNPDDATFNVTYGKDGSIIIEYSNRTNSAPHTVVDKYGNLKLEDLPKGMRKELGTDYETMLEKYNNNQLELRKSIEANNELDNALQGLKATAEVYPLEIERYAEREKRNLGNSLRDKQVQKAETKSLFDQTVKTECGIKNTSRKNF